MNGKFCTNKEPPHCTDDQIWLIGGEYVTANRTDGQRVLARTDIQAKVMLHEGLMVEPVPIPHPRHADIVKWPDAPEQKLEKMNASALQTGEPILAPPLPVTLAIAECPSAVPAAFKQLDLPSWVRHHPKLARTMASLLPCYRNR